MPARRLGHSVLGSSCEILHLSHGSCAEIRAALGFKLDPQRCSGGYPGVVPLVGGAPR